MVKKILIIIVSAVVVLSCQTDMFSEDAIINDPESVVFNSRVQNIKRLVYCLENCVGLVSASYAENTVCLLFEDGNILDFMPMTSAPDLSFFLENGHYCWLLNGNSITDASGRSIEVLASDEYPLFRCMNGSWYMKLNKKYKGKVAVPEAHSCISVVSQDRRFVSLKVNADLQVDVPSVDGLAKIDRNVVSRSFYKDIFMDGGLGLNAREDLPAADALGLSVEMLGYEGGEKVQQNEVLGGNANDWNGILLYPDGQPRYRILFVLGGNSRSHGNSLTEKERNAMRCFYQNGGSYVGTCAGAFLASEGYDDVPKCDLYLGLWPTPMFHTGLSETSTGMFIVDDSPLLRYDDFGGDQYVSEVKHNKGGYPKDIAEFGEVLARYDYPDLSSVHMQPAIWAYKQSDTTGRLVLSGSHPEPYKVGERVALAEAMLQYALDGLGCIRFKAVLQNGFERIMDCTSKDECPAFTAVGDLQYHHFLVCVPEDATKLEVELKGDGRHRLELMASDSSVPFEGDAKSLGMERGSMSTLEVDSPSPGIWAISVHCSDTVTARRNDNNTEYSGDLTVLDGVPYSIKAIIKRR